MVIETLRPRFGHHLLQTYDKLWLTRLRAVSIFSWSVEQNARDTQMTTRVTEGARRERHVTLVSRVFAAQRPHARALPLLNLREKRGCSQCSGFHVCFHSSTSILAKKLLQTTIKKQKSLKRSLKSRISSQTWDCDVLGYKKPCGKSLTSGA